MIHPLILLFAATFAQAAINGTCTTGSTPGICLTTSSCSSSGGTSHPGYCPNDPTNVQCCTKTCGNGGICRFSNSCSGTTKTGLCPGPSSFLCCLSSSGGTSSCGAPAVNAATVTAIKYFEGFVASPSPDPIGLPTVGYGHLCQKPKCAEVSYSFPLTQAQASALLTSDLKTYESCITKDISNPVRLNANQYGALCSWAFNEGCEAVRTSTLIKRLNEGQDPNIVAAQELPKWVCAGGKVLEGLKNRRAAEVKLFQTASDVVAHPAPC